MQGHEIKSLRLQKNLFQDLEMDNTLCTRLSLLISSSLEDAQNALKQCKALHLWNKLRMEYLQAQINS